MRALLVTLVVGGLAGCGSAAAPGDGSGPDVVGVDVPDVPRDMTLADLADAAGGGGAEVSGDVGSPKCPAAAPTAGAACSGPPCYYQDCAGAGRTVATCANGAWQIETGSCADVPCGALTCPPTQLCMEIAGDALRTTCAVSICGTGPISCGCLPCQGNCNVGGTASTGITVHCSP